MNLVGTMSIGIKGPIIKKGDDLVNIVCDSVISACEKHNLQLEDRDIVSVTEAVVAKAQGNFATLDDIATDVNEKFGDSTVGLIFPILSRNRFLLLLKGTAKGVKKLVKDPEKDFVPYEVLDYNKIDKTSELLKTKMSLKEIYEEVFNKVDNL